MHRRQDQRRRVKQPRQFLFLALFATLIALMSVISIYTGNVLAGNHPDSNFHLTEVSRKKWSSSPASPLTVDHQAESSSSPGNTTTSITRKNQTTFDRYPSVDYYACCGLGHRLIRMASAHLVAKELGSQFTLRSFWGYCGSSSTDDNDPTEVFSHLFEPPSIPTATTLAKEDIIQDQYIPVYYDVKPGYETLRRGNYSLLRSQQCPCRLDEFQTNLDFYTSLRNRFRFNAKVEDFVQQHFANNNATVLGLHVRAGNGEQGDFQAKQRGISNPSLWVKQVCQQLQLFLSRQDDDAHVLRKPPILFLATDTPSMIELFESELSKSSSRFKIPVVVFPQTRLDEGQGVLYGETAHENVLSKTNNVKQQCLSAWEDALIDMFLLSHADLVIAGKPSTFIQSLPMTIAFGRPQSNRPFAPYSYCELQPFLERENGNEDSGDWIETDQRLECYGNFVEWCCNAPRRSKEMVIVRDLSIPTTRFRVKQRSPSCQRPPPDATTFTRYCLPHEWTESREPSRVSDKL